MITTDKYYKQMFKDGSIQEYKIEIDGVEYTGGQILDHPRLSQLLFDKDTMTIGSLTSSEFKAKLRIPSAEIARNANIKFYYRYLAREPIPINLIKDDFSDFTAYQGAVVTRNKTFPIDVFKGGRNWARVTRTEFRRVSIGRHSGSLRGAGVMANPTYDFSEMGITATNNKISIGAYIEVEGIKETGFRIDATRLDNTTQNNAYTVNTIRTNKGELRQVITVDTTLHKSISIYLSPIEYTEPYYADVKEFKVATTNNPNEPYAPSPIDGYGYTGEDGAYHIQGQGNFSNILDLPNAQSNVDVHDWGGATLNGEVLALNETTHYTGSESQLDFNGDLDFIASDPMIYADLATESQWVQKFSGRVTKRDELDSETTSITAHDKAANYDKFLDVITNITTYPHNARVIAQRCATHLGLTINTSQIINQDVVEYPNELTVIQVLQNIAGLSGGNFVVTETDELKLINLTNVSPTEKFSATNIVAHEVIDAITQVRAYYSDENAFESGLDGMILENDNIWATQASTNFVLSKVKNYVYIPIQGTKVYLDPAYQVGDSFLYSDGQKQLIGGIDWTFDGSATANVKAPIRDDSNLDDPYEILRQQEFKKKVSLGANYQGTTISRDKGIETLLSTDGTLANATGRFYADLTRGLAFQYRGSPSGSWQDFLYFDYPSKSFKINLSSDDLYKSWFAYSENANGVPFTTDPQPSSRYIGTASAIDRPTLAADYKWILIKGADGIDGVGVESTTITYAASTSGVTPPTSPWTSSIPTVPKGQYLWTRTVITYTDNTTSTSYSVAYEANDGKGIDTSVITYATSSNGITPPTTWTTTIPSVVKGQYLWTRTVITYTDNTTSTSYSVAQYALDGRQPFIAYADNDTGTENFSITDNKRKFQGIYIGYPPQSTTPSMYTWSESTWGNAQDIAHLDERTVEIEANLDGISASVENIHNGNLIYGLNGENGHGGWIGGSELLYVNSLYPRYDKYIKYNHGFYFIKDDTTMCGERLIFINDGFDITPIARIIPNKDYSFKGVIKRYRPFNIELLEYNSSMTLIKRTRFNGTNTPEFEFTKTPETETQFARLQFNRTSTTWNNTFELTDMMFNRGSPQNWFASAEDSMSHSIAAIDVLSNEVVLKVDGDGRMVTQALGVNSGGSYYKLKADDISLEGYTTINGHFTVDLQGNVTMRDATMENATITGNLTAGTIAGLLFDGTGIKFPNSRLSLNSVDSSIDFGDMTLKSFTAKDPNSGINWEFAKLQAKTGTGAIEFWTYQNYSEIQVNNVLADSIGTVFNFVNEVWAKEVLYPRIHQPTITMSDADQTVYRIIRDSNGFLKAVV